SSVASAVQLSIVAPIGARLRPPVATARESSPCTPARRTQPSSSLNLLGLSEQVVARDWLTSSGCWSQARCVLLRRCPATPRSVYQAEERAADRRSDGREVGHALTSSRRGRELR